MLCGDGRADECICGDVDAGALSFIMDKEGMDGAGLSDLINKRSGVAKENGQFLCSFFCSIRWVCL